MKTLSAMAVLLLATSLGSANPKPPSDIFEVFEPSGGSFLELLYFGDDGFMIENGVELSPAPFKGSLVFTGIEGDVSMSGSPMFLLEPDGSVSDQFGVFPNPDTGTDEVAFISYPEDNPLTIVLPPGAVVVFEPQQPFAFVPVTQYLEPQLQQQGYTAVFASFPATATPADAASTCYLLGLGMAALGALRRFAA
jgi:hypothetical protein